MNYAAIIIGANFLFLALSTKAEDFADFPYADFKEDVQYDDNGVMKTLTATQGAQADVFFRVNRTTGDRVALKVYAKDSRHSAEREIEILRLIQSIPNVVQFVGAYENAEQRIIVITKLAGTTDVRSYLAKGGSFSAEEIRRIMEILFAVVDALNAAGIVHTDLKPDNLVLTNSREIVLIDFGLACRVTPGASTGKFHGTSHYMAPEALEGESQTFVSDCYSLGTILLALFMRNYRGPFYHNCMPECSHVSTDMTAFTWEVLQNMRNWRINPFFPIDMPLGAQDLAIHLLEYAEVERYTTRQALEHPWITGEDAAFSYASSSPQLTDVPTPQTAAGPSAPTSPTAPAAPSPGPSVPAVPAAPTAPAVASAVSSRVSSRKRKSSATNHKKSSKRIRE